MPLFVGLTLVLVGAIAYLTHRSGQILPTLPRGTNILLSPPDLAARAVVCAMLVGLGAASPVPAERLGWMPAAPGDDALIGLGLGALVHVLLYRPVQWLAPRLGSGAYSNRLLHYVLPRGRRDWMVLPVAFGLAVLLEELLFRSLLVGGFSLLVPAQALAVAGAVLFGWMHAPQGWLGMLLAGLVGLALSEVFLWRGSLVAPLVAHYVFNLLQLVRAANDPMVEEPPGGDVGA